MPCSAAYVQTSSVIRAEVRAAHGAPACAEPSAGREVRGLCAFPRQGFVVEFARGDGVEAEVELIFPAEFKARLAQRFVAVLRARPSPRRSVAQICRIFTAHRGVTHEGLSRFGHAGGMAFRQIGRVRGDLVGFVGGSHFACRSFSNPALSDNQYSSCCLAPFSVARSVCAGG